MSRIQLPYEPTYTGHREAEKRHREVKEWLRERERELEESPSIVPANRPDGDTAA
jgi:hypothetical protein